MFHVVFCILLLVIYMYAVVDQLPRLGKRELICLLLFTCIYVGSVRRGFHFRWVLGMGCVILLWHSLSLPYNYFLLQSAAQNHTFCCISFKTVTIATQRSVFVKNPENRLLGNRNKEYL